MMHLLQLYRNWKRSIHSRHFTTIDLKVLLHYSILFYVSDGMDKEEGDEDVERWEEEGMLSRRLLTRQRLDQEERRMGRVSTVQ